MSETLDINKNIWLWLSATKGISNYHSTFIDGSADIDSWNEFPEFKNLVDTSTIDKFTAYQDAVSERGSNFLKNFIKASMYPLFCKDLKDIQQPTINQLYFDGGYVIGPKDDFLGTFDTLSICQTIKINSHDFENYNFLFSLGAYGIRSFNDAIAFYIYKNTVTGNENFGFSVIYAKDRHSDELSEDKTYTNYSLSAYTKILDGKFHTISLIFKVGEKLKLYVDGVLVATSGDTMPYSLVRAKISSSYQYYSYGVGCRPAPIAPSALKSASISDVAVFNFDITADDAPYSINDYQNGKPIPPYLLDRTFIQSSDGNTTVRAESSSMFTASVVDGKVRITKLNNNTSSWNIFSFTPTRSIKAGDVLTFTFSPVVLVAGDTGEEYYLSPTSTTGYQLAESNFGTKIPIGITFVNGGTNTIVAPKDYSTIRITLPSYANSFQNAPYPENSDSGIIREGDYITFSFSMKVNGAELALENYTFGGEVLDYSGHNRNGTIRGVVEEPMTSRYGLGTLISILNLNPRFIELTKDDHNTYINNVSNIMVNKDLNLRPHLNALIKLLKDNESEVLSYIDNQGLADEYNGSTSDYEKLGFLFCALLKELRTIALEENLINY